MESDEAQADFKLLIPLPPPPQCHTTTPVCVILGVEPRALCMLGECLPTELHTQSHYTSF